jgi:phenylacetate-coenzyme A ligase PaaK-like adenylate-forming protein
MHAQSRQLYQKIRAMQPDQFEQVALEVFRFQATANPVYAQFLELLQVDPARIQQVTDIPFLPIELFKTYSVQAGTWEPVAVFSSSGTTGSTPSRHLIRSQEWYAEQAIRGVESFYGPVSDYCFLALLPHYLDRTGSSLVEMVRVFMEQSGHPANGFFLRDQEGLVARLRQCQQNQVPTILIGVSFALWDLAEAYPMDLSGITVMETGGMKGQRRELVREELHDILREAFGLSAIHSEYGMTELLSQAYSQGEGRFYPAPTMRVTLADITDPFSAPLPGRSGQIQVIDLANVDSCSFIATEDIGRMHADGSFEVLGRLDRAAWRGCNLMVLD